MYKMFQSVLFDQQVTCLGSLLYLFLEGFGGIFFQTYVVIWYEGIYFLLQCVLMDYNRSFIFVCSGYC